jgi:hypothetical protein
VLASPVAPKSNVLEELEKSSCSEAESMISDDSIDEIRASGSHELKKGAELTRQQFIYLRVKQMSDITYT